MITDPYSNLTGSERGENERAIHDRGCFENSINNIKYQNTTFTKSYLDAGCLNGCFVRLLVAEWFRFGGLSAWLSSYSSAIFALGTDVISGNLATSSVSKN